VYQIDINDIAKCTSMLDNWEQHKNGPQTFVKPKTPFKRTHIWIISISNMNKIKETEASPAKKQPEVLAPPRLMKTDSVYPQLQFPQSFSDAIKKHYQELQKSSNDPPRPREKGQGVITNSIAILNCKTLW
jgi:hypothetical protein